MSPSRHIELDVDVGAGRQGLECYTGRGEAQACGSGAATNRRGHGGDCARDGVSAGQGAEAFGTRMRAPTSVSSGPNISSERTAIGVMSLYGNVSRLPQDCTNQKSFATQRFALSSALASDCDVKPDDAWVPSNDSRLSREVATRKAFVQLPLCNPPHASTLASILHNFSYEIRSASAQQTSSQRLPRAEHEVSTDLSIPRTHIRNVRPSNALDRCRSARSNTRNCCQPSFSCPTPAPSKIAYRPIPVRSDSVDSSSSEAAYGASATQGSQLAPILIGGAQDDALVDEEKLGKLADTDPDLRNAFHRPEITEFRIGNAQKRYHVLTSVLTLRSPYFRSFAQPDRVTLIGASGPYAPVHGPFTYIDLDDFDFLLFARWLMGNGGQPMPKPKSFHDVGHYIGCYVMALRWDIEPLKNTCMDYVREYYHANDFTAPVYRIDYIYDRTSGPCFMRQFLIMTAAYRLTSPKQDGQSESMKTALAKGGAVVLDLVDALVLLAKNGRTDSRTGDPCKWHEHTITLKCPPWSAQPWEAEA
ncbi:hypothetical protein MRB53_040615 [Persea americana]|nr:hypothetical protein MRB53_040615 [Persea americana]